MGRTCRQKGRAPYQIWYTVLYTLVINCNCWVAAAIFGCYLCQWILLQNGVHTSACAQKSCLTKCLPDLQITHSQYKMGPYKILGHAQKGFYYKRAFWGGLI